MLGLALLVTVINAWLAARALGTLFNAEHWLAHTLTVLADVSDATEQLAITNSATRGYLLVGSPVFLGRAQAAEYRLRQELNSVQRDTLDNKSQQARIQLLKSRVQVKLGAMDAATAMRKAYARGASLPEVILTPALADSPDGQVSARDLLREIRVEEEHLLSLREEEAQQAHREVWVTFSIATLFDVVLLITGFLLLVRSAEAQEVIAENNAKIIALNSDLSALNGALEERVQDRTRELAVSNQELEAFSYSVSHDLRAPLRTIDGFSLALEEDFADKLDDEGRDYIRRVRGGVQRMGQLIDALLQLSRVTRTDLQREPVDLSQLATLVYNEVASADPERKVRWVVQPDVHASADPRLLRVALENLLGNAWKFTSRTVDACIEFGSTSGPKGTVYFLKDNGAGFDMKYVDRLFTAFQRLHGDRDFKGSGIGLATVSRIIRRHHGEIWAEGKPDLGATFLFTLGE